MIAVILLMLSLFSGEAGKGEFTEHYLPTDP